MRSAEVALAPSSDGAPPESCGEGRPTKVVAGPFGQDLQGWYVLVPFRVPRGTTRVNVRICYDQSESPTLSQVRHMIDLGLYGPRTSRDRLWDREEFLG